MEDKALKKLEFDKICARLSSLASSASGKELCETLKPEQELW